MSATHTDKIAHHRAAQRRQAAVLEAARERLAQSPHPMTTRELGEALAFRVSMDLNQVLSALTALAPKCGMARKGEPETRLVYGNETVVRPWVWLPEAEWSSAPVPATDAARRELSADVGVSLLDRIAALEARIEALELSHIL